jgi:enamine deaminase RidA (YjgF/YER057c/UK114 family)
VAAGSRTVHVSGQTAWDAGRRILGGHDLAAQVRHALENLRTAMRACGGDLANVVSLRIYVVGWIRPSPSKARGGRRRAARGLPRGRAPARARGSASPRSRGPSSSIEIEATGVLD